MARSVTRALAVLFAVRAAGRPLGLAELAAEVDLDKATILRLLGDLIERDLIRLDGAAKLYNLGFGLVELAAGLWQGADGLAAVRPLLAELNEETQHTVGFDVRVGFDHLTLVAYEGLLAVKASYRVGARAPLHSGAAGQAILAHSSDSVREAILGSALQALTSRTIVDPDDLRDRLSEVRRLGYAATKGERIEGLIGIAAPVFDAGGLAVGALVVVAPESRTGDALTQLSLHIPSLKRRAEHASALISIMGLNGSGLAAQARASALIREPGITGIPEAAFDG